MRFRLHDSVLLRTVLVLFAGLVVSQSLGFVIWEADRNIAVSSLESYRIAERIASITAAVNKQPTDERPVILDAMNHPPYRVSWNDVPSTPEAELDADGRRMLDLLRHRIGGTPDDGIRVAILPSTVAPDVENLMTRAIGDDSPARTYPLPRVFAELVEGPRYWISVQLRDATWLNFSVPFVETLSFWSWRLIAPLVLSGFVVLAVSAWAVQRWVRPLEALSAAANRLGTDVNAPPLPEEGPPDVRNAAHAFNEMQHRIRRFVEDRTQMLAAISHDLRTPIMRMRLRAECVENDLEREKMMADLDEMEAIVSSTLSFAREDANYEANIIIDLVAVLRRICADLADVGLDVSFGGYGRLPFFCRPTSLRRAFTNIIENAVKYGRRARVKLVPSAHSIAIQIDDDGPGIPEAEQEKVFQPFYRLERSRNRATGGTGLGLPVARTVARAHGGDVILSNRKGGGLRVIVTLPRHSWTAKEVPKTRAAAGG